MGNAVGRLSMGVGISDVTVWLSGIVATVGLVTSSLGHCSIGELDLTIQKVSMESGRFCTVMLTVELAHSCRAVSSRDAFSPTITRSLAWKVTVCGKEEKHWKTPLVM